MTGETVRRMIQKLPPNPPVRKLGDSGTDRREPARPGRYIAIEGVIGVGKTSLRDSLAERLHARLLPEEPRRTRFLEDFIKDPRRHAFSTQMFFLVSRYHELRELRQPDLFHDAVVSDYIFRKTGSSPT